MSRDHLQPPAVRIDPFEPVDVRAIAMFVEAIQDHERVGNRDLRPGADINPSYVEMIVRNVAERQGAILMARTDAETIGFICAWKQQDDDALLREEARAGGYISDLFVVERWRALGVGHLLLEAIEAEMAARGCRRMRVCCKASNAIALRTYERVGFRPCEVTLAKTIG
jgi:ribosomal protein S18 acetylase RimI-like enzyme